MTKIKDILSIRLEDDIKSVIDLNQQDERSIIDELDGFILTESLAKHLADFCDFFTSNTAQARIVAEWLLWFRKIILLQDDRFPPEEPNSSRDFCP